MKPILIPVVVQVPLSEYPALSRRAERLGFDSIPEMLLAGAARDIPKQDLLLLELEELHEAGLCDGDIAGALGITPAAVAGRRRKLGLAANRRYPTRKDISA